MARTKSQYANRDWKMFRITPEDHTWLDVFRARNSIDFQDASELAMRIGFDLLDGEIGPVKSDEWKAIRIPLELYNKAKELAVDSVRLQAVGVALFSMARSVMDNREYLLEFLNEMDMSDGTKFAAHMRTLKLRIRG